MTSEIAFAGDLPRKLTFAAGRSASGSELRRRYAFHPSKHLTCSRIALAARPAKCNRSNFFENDRRSFRSTKTVGYSGKAGPSAIARRVF